VRGRLAGGSNLKNDGATGARTHRFVASRAFDRRPIAIDATLGKPVAISAGQTSHSRTNSQRGNRYANLPGQAAACVELSVTSAYHFEARRNAALRRSLLAVAANRIRRFAAGGVDGTEFTFGAFARWGNGIAGRGATDLDGYRTGSPSLGPVGGRGRGSRLGCAVDRSERSVPAEVAGPQQPKAEPDFC